jgi:hypothetical protein
MILMMGKRWFSFTVLFEYNFDQLGYGLDYVYKKKKVLFYLYPNRKIVTVIQVSASQFVVAGRLCSLLNWNDNGYSITNGFVKWK